MERVRPAGVVGPLLRRWRERRRLSQLSLAAETEVSARHLSFVETGRAQPSREMVLLLARVLDYDITLRELRVECFFPADPPSERLMRRLAREAGASGRPR